MKNIDHRKWPRLAVAVRIVSRPSLDTLSGDRVPPVMSRRLADELAAEIAAHPDNREGWSVDQLVCALVGMSAAIGVEVAS